MQALHRQRAEGVRVSATDLAKLRELAGEARPA
jgi:hypothetical protein